MIAVIGGTGSLGKGIAGRLADAGHEVIVGSRDEGKAKKSASAISEMIDGNIEGCENLEAVSKATLVVLSVPYSAIDSIIERIDPGLEPGNVLVSVIVPLTRGEDGFKVLETDYNSVAEEIKDKSSEEVSVVSGFQVVPASMMADFDNEVDSDVPIASDDEDAKARVKELIEDIPGARAIDAGSLSSSGMIESMATLFVELTRIHGNEVSLRFCGI
ncbi:MAG: NADPH-dependent F420 reductase [Candidatus Hadarchaeia archaeon]